MAASPILHIKMRLQLETFRFLKAVQWSNVTLLPNTVGLVVDSLKAND